jgi:hypothetical protein
MIADADDEIARLQQEETELAKALAADTITNKADFFSRLDLESYEGRARANELLKRLGILVTAFKVDDTITYDVYRKELKILTMTDAGDGVRITRSYSGEVTTAMYRQGEITKDELFVNGSFNRKLKKPGEPAKPAATEAGPDWSGYEEPDWYTVTNELGDEYTVDAGSTDEAVNTN